MKIKLNRGLCIGCGSCQVLCSKQFELAEDGKSHLIGAEKAEMEELEVKKLECAESAAEACPVQCISVEKNKQDDQINS